MSKKLVSYRLSQDNRDYVDSMSDKWGLDKTETITRIIREYRNSETGYIDALSDSLLSKIDEKYDDRIKRIELHASYTDKYVQTILELMNSVLWSFKIDNYINSAGSKHPVLQQVENEIKRRIATTKERFDNSKKES